ncbi:uncharacterized protein LOC143258465 [Tachypleus tridentatus]|uniref:uncharacterized protein LOC143258465 n=1 Tax=Tachypleus tridentatus TaxID=6853 RepID=UPI003FD3DFA3
MNHTTEGVYCFLCLCIVVTLAESSYLDNNPDLEAVLLKTGEREHQKRGWNSLSGMWGKRSWKKPSEIMDKRGWKDLSDMLDKRDWNRLSGMWGKRDWNDLSEIWGKGNKEVDSMIPGEGTEDIWIKSIFHEPLEIRGRDSVERVIPEDLTDI